jgi:transposase
MDERVQFISDYQRQLWTMSEICDRYGVSRKTGYKWIARYAANGAAGLAARSSRPQHSPHATDDHIVAAIRAVRKRYPRWGGKKILAVLGAREPEWALPAISTANDILKRAGLVTARRRRRPLAHPGYRPAAVTEPNAVWTADFKGQFRTTDARLCYPLTVCDAWSRFLIRCQGLPAPTTADTIAVFRRAFREYGMPERIPTDKGEPFAAAALRLRGYRSGGFGRIYPELIARSPQQNGAHERIMSHRSRRDAAAGVEPRRTARAIPRLVAATTRSARTKRWASGHRYASTGRRRACFRLASRPSCTPGIMRFAASITPG